jgi:hypothetical protein
MESNASMRTGRPSTKRRVRQATHEPRRALRRTGKLVLNLRPPNTVPASPTNIIIVPRQREHLLPKRERELPPPARARRSSERTGMARLGTTPTGATDVSTHCRLIEEEGPRVAQPCAPAPLHFSHDSAPARLERDPRPNVRYLRTGTTVGGSQPRLFWRAGV